MACAIQLVKSSINALMTKMNKPRVSIPNGSDSRIRIGRITAFTKPKIKATISSVTQSFGGGMRSGGTEMNPRDDPCGDH
jgi:hypothetical protein